MLTPHAREQTQGKSTCEEHLASLGMPSGGAVLRTERYGRSALVVFDDDTMFLTVTGSGWQVTGAGCSARGELPYDCEVGG